MIAPWLPDRPHDDIFVAVAGALYLTIPVALAHQERHRSWECCKICRRPVHGCDHNPSFRGQLYSLWGNSELHILHLHERRYAIVLFINWLLTSYYLPTLFVPVALRRFYLSCLGIKQVKQSGL